MRDLAFALALLAVTAACRQEQPTTSAGDTAPTGRVSTAPVAAPAKASPPAAAVAIPEATHLVLTTEGCTSDAAQVGLDTSPTQAREVFDVLGKMSGFSIVSDVDLSAVTVEANVQDAPWDCLVRSAADQLKLDVVVEGTTVHLRPRAAP